MTRLGYRVFLALFMLLSLSGVLATLVVSWKNQRAPEEVDCREWVERPRRGRFLLTGCKTHPVERAGSTSQVMVGWDDTAQYAWTTRDGEMMRLTDGSREGRRALSRHFASQVEGDIVVEAVRDYNYGYELRDPRRPTVSPWVGVVPFFLFGLPMIWLVTKQRRWRTERLAWERAQGIVTEGDKPTAF